MALRIVNIISTYSLNCKLDLNEISQKDYKTVYKPKRFTALMKKFPKGTALIFPNGKCVIAGTKTIEETQEITSKIAKLVRKFKPKGSNLKIRNIVASCNLTGRATKKEGTIFDLRKIYELASKALYEPERYSALTMDFSGVKVVIFHTGKINITGAKSFEEMNNTFTNVLNFLLYNKFIQ